MKNNRPTEACASQATSVPLLLSQLHPLSPLWLRVWKISEGWNQPCSDTTIIQCLKKGAPGFGRFFLPNSQKYYRFSSFCSALANAKLCGHTCDFQAQDTPLVPTQWIWCIFFHIRIGKNILWVSAFNNFHKIINWGLIFWNGWITERGWIIPTNGFT